MEPTDSLIVIRHTVIGIMAAQSGRQSLHQLRRRQRAIQFKPVLYRLQLRRKSLAHRLSLHAKPPPISRTAAIMRETEKIERFRLLSPVLCILLRIRAKLQHLGLLGR